MLPFREHNSGSRSTIVLIHGAFSCGKEEWAQVLPYLASYHLLVPDLTGHGDARDDYPEFSPDLSARLLADLIREKAHDRRAHIVGFSLGSHVAMRLVTRHPEAVNTVVVTGFNVLSFISPSVLAYTYWLDSKIRNTASRISLGAPEGGVPKLSLCREVMSAVCMENWPSTWHAQTLILAAGRTSCFSSADRIKDALRLRQIGRESNPKTSAFRLPRYSHAWHIEASEIFAKVLTAYFQELPLPDCLEQL